jgi:hypothetical protein
VAPTHTCTGCISQHLMPRFIACTGQSNALSVLQVNRWLSERSRGMTVVGERNETRKVQMVPMLRPNQTGANTVYSFKSTLPTHTPKATDLSV